MASALYRRMRAVACRFWGCAPPLFDQWSSEGQISSIDVIELVHMLAHDPVVSLWLLDYLYPEERQKREEEEAELQRQRKRQEWDITALRMLNHCVPKTPEEAAQIEAMKASIARGT